MIARDLGKGHQEMLDSLSDRELEYWKVLYGIEALEQEEAMAAKGMRG